MNIETYKHYPHGPESRCPGELDYQSEYYLKETHALVVVFIRLPPV
jgi:hypothetical protein